MGLFSNTSGKGKTIVITGAASGVARATVSVLLARKWKVFAIDVNEAGLRSLVEEVAANKKLDASMLTILTCDLSNPDAIAKTCEDINTQLADVENGLDALVNCAGVSFFSPVMGLDWKMIELQIKVNTLAPMLLTRHFFDNLIKGTGGNLVNVSSIGGLKGWPWQGAYSTSKFALEGFTDSLRKELITAKMSHKLRVSTINPGAIDTPMATNMVKGARDWVDNNKESQPLWANAMDKMISKYDNFDISKGEYPFGISKSWILRTPKQVGKVIAKAAGTRHPRYRYIVMAPIFSMLWFLIYRTPTYISDRISANVL